MKRRDILKSLTLLPLAGGVMGSALPAEAKTKPVPIRGSSKRDLFKELGVTPYISCGGTVTVFSGSLMMPETVEAINSTSHAFVDMYQLHAQAGKAIAELVQAESALVSSGAAGAILLGTAACMTGKDKALISAMPDLPGAKREVLKLSGHKYGWDSVMRTAGAKMVYVSAADFDKSFTPNTVMAQYFNGAASKEGGLKYEEFVAICKKHNVPSMIDIAADVPPAENLFKFQKIGFDLVCLSGGKMLKGPQSSGLLYGRKDLIEAAMLNNSPYEVPIARPCKVSKEEIFGMYCAIKSFVERDHDKEWQMWLDRIKHISSVVEKVPSVTSKTTLPTGLINNVPRMSLSWDPAKVKITGEEVAKAMAEGNPAIKASGSGSTLNLGVVLLLDGQDDIVAKRVKEILDPAVVKTAKV